MSESPLDLLFARMEAHPDKDAVVWCDQAYTYRWMLQEIQKCRLWLHEQQLRSGAVILLEADYSPTTVAMLLALWQAETIVVLFAQSSSALKEEFLRISQAEGIISIRDGQHLSYNILKSHASHPLYDRIRSNRHPGLVLFSSGTSGPIKGMVHDAYNLLDKVRRIHPRYQRTLAFLILDHLGGIDTLIYSLANAGCLVVPVERTPDGILESIAKHRVQLLPTSPSFLNLVLLSRAYERHRLDSLEKISYGAEAMPERVLARFHELFPHIKMVQTYASSELGVLRSTSEASDSLWMRVGAEDFETRIVDNVLQVRSSRMMLGYLNAPAAMTEDGWFVTGDIVETSGPYLRVKGRVSDLINVGGEKVNPLEIEDVIRELDEVSDVLVFGESNAILGQIVSARIVLAKQDDQTIQRIRHHCFERLPKYKVPMRIVVVEGDLSGERYKRKRHFD